ncbi:hypothetical protein POTOM_044276 [Populus tomentosa]|uniref:Uncharacterized protein n=1 Tax=Populus tomentosa TaxID=118781 RepID=A0A8X7YP64_POPTO|nr:hypothetical protein POTOM_044276 [Populus tomentosa]
MLGPGSLLGRASEFSKPQFIYVPSSISQGVVDAVGLGAQGNSGLIAADIECSSHLFYVIHLDFVNFRILVSGDSVIVIFAPEDTIQTCAGKLVSADAGVILSSQGVVPYFQIRNSGEPGSFKFPSAIVFATSDRVLQDRSLYIQVIFLPSSLSLLGSVSKWKVLPAYSDSPSIDTLEFAKALSSEERSKWCMESAFFILVAGKGCQVTRDISRLNDASKTSVSDIGSIISVK